MKYLVQFVWKENDELEEEETVYGEYVIEAKSSEQAVAEAKRIHSLETFVKVKPSGVDSVKD